MPWTPLLLGLLLTAARLPPTDVRGRIWTKADVLALFDGPRPPMTKSEIDVDAGCGCWRIVASQGTQVQ